MTEFLNQMFANMFGDNVILATILISMLPLIELRGAIPFATNTHFWGSNTMNNWTAFGWGLLGSSLVVFLIALLFVPIMNWLKKFKPFKKLADGIENRLKSKSSNIEDVDVKSKKFSKSYFKKMLAVFLFVAVPLPLTGVWTGTCLAVFVGLDYLSSCLTIISGNVVAGLLITLILQFFPWLNDWLFYILIALIFVVVIIEIIKHFRKNKNKKANSTEE